MNKSYINYNQRAVIEPQTTDDNKRSVEGILTTETPVTVFDFYRWDFINEVLMLDGMDKTKKIPLIDAHDRSTSKNVIGSTTDFKIVELEDGTRAVRVINTFSTVENDFFIKVKEGHIDSTSVGYRVYDEHSTILKPGEKAIIRNREFENVDKKKDLIIRSKWTPMENSLVPIGADQKSKFRAAIEVPENRTEENKTDIITDTEPIKDTKGVNRMQMNENIFKRLK
jgi:hypothetical protein